MFKQIYIHYNLFRPDFCQCRCDELIHDLYKKKSSDDCFCVPNNILKITNEFFGLNENKKSKCSLFGMRASSAISKEIGFSVHQLPKFKPSQRDRSLKTMRLLTEPDDRKTSLKDYAIMLCAHFGTIIRTTRSISKSTYDVFYTTMLNEIDNAYRMRSQNIDQSIESLLREIYFYICFCVKGGQTFNNAEDLITFYKKISEKDSKAAYNIYQNLKNFTEYCRSHEDFLSSVHEYLRNEGSTNYLACVFQFLLDLRKYDFSIPANGETDVDRLHFLSCDPFLELSKRVNTAFEPSSNPLSPECLLDQMAFV